MIRDHHVGPALKRARATLSLVGGLPLVVVLAAIGANTYWISLVLKLRHLLGDAETETVAA